MIIAYITLAVVALVLTLYFIYKSREFRKFLSGAFFVSGGIQIYLYMAKVSVPILGTNFVQTPYVSEIRGSIHLLFSVLCFYFGFIRPANNKL